MVYCLHARSHRKSRFVDNWTSYEPVFREAERERRPFSDVLFGGSGDRPHRALRVIELLRLGGFPPPAGSIAYEPADDQQPRIYYIKCKPSCWRLYAYVDQEKRQVLFLHCACKKGWKADPKDATRARMLLDRAFDGEVKFEPLELPD